MAIDRVAVESRSGCVYGKTGVEADTEVVSGGGARGCERRFVFFVKMCTGKPVLGEVDSGGREEACAQLPARDLKRLARVRCGAGRQTGVTRCTGGACEVYGDDERVKVGLGETIEVFDVKPGVSSGGGDAPRRIFPYLTFIKPDNTKVRRRVAQL